MEKILWHALPITKVLAKLQMTKAGLTEKEAKKRLKKFGHNKLPEEKKLSGLVIFFNQFKSPLVYILLGAAVITFFLQNFIDMAVILLAVFINTILGFYQENKANKAITQLKLLVDFQAKVLRDKNEKKIPVSQLVPGDIIFIQAGDKIPADARLIEAQNLQVVEAALTGESIPSEKQIKVLDKGTVLADRENMIYMGTTVADGKGKAVICATGLKTELGEITQLIKKTPEEKTPLQKQLARFAKTLTWLVAFICLTILIFGVLQGRPIFDYGLAAREGMLNMAVAIAVAAIPEGLLVAVTVILAIGMQRILREKALVRKLIAAETLGSVSVICTDKTGTITAGEMQVSRIITYSESLELKKPIKIKYQNAEVLADHDLILKICLLCNNAVIENPEDELKKWKIIGDPTEKALLLAAIESGLNKKQLEEFQPRLLEIPFSSETKFMVTLNKLDKQRNVIYIKGAPEKILAMSTKVRINAQKENLTTDRLKSLQDKCKILTEKGLRILAFAYKQVGEIKDLQSELKDLIFLGFVALKDPLRPEAKETFQLTKKAGIRPIIVTGDHKLTAKTIVSELGLKVKEENILEGQDLDKISDEDLKKKVSHIDIYARVNPKHKLRIIDAWQAKDEVVAMTGDGVNDAPALKSADVGVALGSGTDVAKETSDMVLLDNNFKTIVSAIREGRIIFDNIKKVILYLLSDAFAEIILITSSLILSLPLPVLPAQILWVNLIADGLPALALTLERGEKDVMNYPPRKKIAPVLDKEMKVLIFIIGIFVNLVLLGLFLYLLRIHNNINYIRTFIFAALAISSLIYVFACRSLRHSIFTKNPFSNIYLILGVIVGWVLVLLPIYNPFFQKILNTVALELKDWLLIIGLGLLQILGIEITKYIFVIKKRKSKI